MHNGERAERLLKGGLDPLKRNLLPTPAGWVLTVVVDLCPLCCGELQLTGSVY
jgi:hypothetical protein